MRRPAGANDIVVASMKGPSRRRGNFNDRPDALSSLTKPQ